MSYKRHSVALRVDHGNFRRSGPIFRGGRQLCPCFLAELSRPPITSDQSARLSPGRKSYWLKLTVIPVGTRKVGGNPPPSSAEDNSGTRCKVELARTAQVRNFFEPATVLTAWITFAVSSRMSFGGSFDLHCSLS